MTRADDKRGRILKAAETLFATRRYHEVTLDEITRIAKIGKGTIYLYFKNKEDLFFHTITAGSDELCALVKEKAPNNAPFEDRLLAMCREITSYFQPKRHLFRMLHESAGAMRDPGGHIRKRFWSKKQNLQDAVAEVMAAGAEEKRLRPDVPPLTLAHFLLSMLAARGREFDSDENRPPLEMIVNIFFNGVAHRASSHNNHHPLRSSQTLRLGARAVFAAEARKESAL
ncbi:MAG: TetR/AcrR family transcriptional regulator [Candidatus Sumerlaeota bacterium]|nr:TetR/AcrR family transcriptional regulator [Candidatus Sumerlaeota bacterium]